MIASLRVPLAFVRRDMLIERSYKAGLLLRIGAIAVSVAVFYFLSTFLASVARPIAGPYGGDYFAFLLLGVALNEYVNQGTGGLGSSLREAQTTGTLELVLASPTRLSSVMLSSMLWIDISASLTVLGYLFVGSLLGLRFALGNLPVALLGLAVSLAAFAGLAILSGALVILIKRGNPVGWAIRGASIVLGGVLYPVSVLPEPLQVLAQVLPITHALELLRGALIGGLGFADLAPRFWALCALTLLYLPLGLLASGAAIRIARTDGSLAQY